MLENIKYLERNRYDDFFFELFLETLENFSTIGRSYSAYYNLYQLGMIETSDDFVVWAGVDTLFLKQVNTLADRYPNKKFIIFCITLDKEHVEKPNVQFINWGPHLRQQQEYKKILPIDKKFQQPWHWHSISGYTRHHRMMLAVILASLDCEKHGYLQVNPFAIHEYNEWTRFYKVQGELRFPFDSFNEQTVALDKGFDKWKNETINLYPAMPNTSQYNGNNAENLDTYLRQYYEHSAVEVITETEYYSKGHHTSEKFLHCMIGSCIPLLIGQQYHVRYLQQLGFDMFEDIIDISYDEIEDPLLRMYTAVKNNLRILTEKDFCVDLHRTCDERLKNNRELAVNGIFDLVRQNTKEEIRRACYWLSE
jgi:hypothetical protein